VAGYNQRTERPWPQAPRSVSARSPRFVTSITTGAEASFVSPYYRPWRFGVLSPRPERSLASGRSGNGDEHPVTQLRRPLPTRQRPAGENISADPPSGEPPSGKPRLLRPRWDGGGPRPSAAGSLRRSARGAAAGEEGGMAGAAL